MNLRVAQKQLNDMGVRAPRGHKLWPMYDLHPTFRGKKNVFAFMGIVPLSILSSADYQRMLFSRHKIQDRFDIRKCLPLQLSLRDNNLFNMDGLQRSGALDEKGYIRTYAQIHVGLTYTDEANFFFDWNELPKQMSGWTKFRAGLKAGEKKYASLLKLASDFELTTPLSPGVDKASHADIKSTSYLLHPFSQGGLELVDWVLSVLDCWRIGGKSSPIQEAAKKTDLIRGLTYFLLEHAMGENPIPWPEIRRRLRGKKGFSAMELTKKARKQDAKGRIDARQYHDALCAEFKRPKAVTVVNLKAA